MPGGGYKYLGGCRWGRGANEAWIDENGLAHWLSIEVSPGQTKPMPGNRMYHWVYNPYTGQLRLWCGHYKSADGWLGRDWAAPPQSLSAYFEEWRCVFAER
jgi:hypothetical protein